ncbi:MAG: ABC transporter substrate-binding protein, partial [Thermoleophilia bacterium]|nr:ABC transporter substrate-binding protein [Thermoleophilia bacterium]
MAEKDRTAQTETVQDDLGLTGRTVSRREFLKLAGLAGATVGLGAGLGGLLAACGASTSTETSGETGTTASGGGGTPTGDEIKIGFVSPLTGGLASFGVPDQYCVERWKEAVKDGLVCGDGKKHPITIILKDSQSDSNRAAQVAGDLINNDGVDIILVASTPDTVAPVADQCEANGVPCLSNDCPWQPYFFGRNGDPATGFQWTYHFFWGLEDIIATFSDMWPHIDTNKTVA